MSLSIADVLKHIRDELEFLVNDSKAFNFDSFQNDKKTILSYTRSFEIIGEACKNIPEAFRNRHPQIDWKGFAGLRDIIIHQYFGIDYAAIWDTVENEVPETYSAILRIIESEEK
jgi:uncharacterized protein with HEPN domain